MVVNAKNKATAEVNAGSMGYLGALSAKGLNNDPCEYTGRPLSFGDLDGGAGGSIVMQAFALFNVGEKTVRGRVAEMGIILNNRAYWI
jgi:hypothetical protein